MSRKWAERLGRVALGLFWAVIVAGVVAAFANSLRQRECTQAGGVWAEFTNDAGCYDARVMEVARNFKVRP
jgi:hypothetical protein